MISIQRSLLAGAMVLGLGFGSVAKADTIVGSLSVLGSGTSITAGTDLSDATEITINNLLADTAFGDYVGTIAGVIQSPLVIDLTAPTTVSFGAAGWGTFQAGAGSFIVSRSANFLDLYLLGVFTPEAGGTLDGFDPSPTSVRFSFNKTGLAVSSSGTLSSPPVAVPEPASFAVAGLGLLGVGLVARRRTARA